MANDVNAFLTSHSAPPHMTYNSIAFQNGNHLKVEIPKSGRHLSPQDFPPTEQSRRTSMDHMHNEMTNREYGSPSLSQSCGTSEDSDEERELEPSDFVFFAANSTFHGISHIFTGTGFTLRKLFWSLAFVSSLGLFLYQAQNRYRYYRSNPHVTKIHEEEASIMNYPAITICNMNSFRLSALTTDDYFHAGQDILKLFDQYYEVNKNDYQDDKTWSKVRRKIQPILDQQGEYKPNMTALNMFEFYNRVGHSKQEMIKSCKFKGSPCGEGNWTEVYTRYGKCFMFNPGPPKSKKILQTRKGGVANGLEMLLDTEQDEYMPIWGEFDDVSIAAGFKVQIHKQKEPPYIHELGFSVSPGFQTLIAAQEQQVTFLSAPYGNCSAKFDSNQHQFYKTYSISACRLTCETKHVVHDCRCKMIHMPGNVSYCDASNSRCAENTLKRLLDSKEDLCKCGTPCNVTRYNREMSTLKLPSTQALSYMAFKYNKTEKYVRENFAKLNIFFEALNYETIQQKKAYEIAGLFGDIGGQMGLFIGASILTVLEIIDYIYEVLKKKIFGRKRNDGKSNPSISSKQTTRKNEIEMMQNLGQKKFSKMDGRLSHTVSSEPYNPLSPLKNSGTFSKRQFEEEDDEEEAGDYELCSQQFPPGSPHLGNSVMTQNQAQCFERNLEAAAKGNLNYPRALYSEKVRQASLSHNDIYERPNRCLYGGSNSRNVSPSRRGTPVLNQPRREYLIDDMTPTSSAGGFGHYSEYAPQNASQQHLLIGYSPAHTFATDFHDYPTSIETDIH